MFSVNELQMKAIIKLLRTGAQMADDAESYHKGRRKLWAAEMRQLAKELASQKLGEQQ